MVQLWVNPAVASTEPKPNAAINSATHTGADMKSFQAIELRQGSSATKVGPEVIVDAIRVGTAWTDLFDVASTEPTMTVTPTVVYDGSAVAIGSSTTFATYDVEYANLEILSTFTSLVPTATNLRFLPKLFLLAAAKPLSPSPTSHRL